MSCPHPPKSRLPARRILPDRRVTRLATTFGEEPPGFAPAIIFHSSPDFGELPSAPSLGVDDGRMAPDS